MKTSSFRFRFDAVFSLAPCSVAARGDAKEHGVCFPP